MSWTAVGICTATILLLAKRATGAECSSRDIENPIVLEGSAAMSLHRSIVDVAKSYEKIRSKVGHQVNINVKSTASSVDHLDYGSNGDYHFSITDTNVASLLETDPEMSAMISEALVLPTQAAYLVLCYNLHEDHDLTLSRRSIVRIFTGQAMLWNDSEILNLNRGERFDGEVIKPVVRADDSGETFIFTGALLGAKGVKMWAEPFSSPNFTGGVCCKARNWNYPAAYYYADGVVGVAGVVKSIPHTIVYINKEIAERNNLTWVKLDNGRGQIVEATDATMQRVMEYAFVMKGDAMFDLTAAAVSTSSYPFASRHYLISPQTHYYGVDCCEIRETVGFIDHYMKAKVIGMVQPPESVAKATLELLKQVTCDGLNMHDIYMESTIATSQTFLTTFAVILASVSAVSAIVAVTALGISSYRKVNKDMTNYILPHSEVKVTSGSASTHSSTDAMNAEYQYNKVMLSELECPTPNRWRRKTKTIAVRELKRINKTNILPCYGYYTTGKTVYGVWEFPAKGSLQRAIGGAKFEIDQDIKALLSLNVADGVHYLHQHGIVLGNLSSKSCYLDGGWTLKIGHWLDNAIYSIETPEVLAAYHHADVKGLTTEQITELYFKDPRTLSGVTDKKADLFSIGMLLHEIFSIESNTDRRASNANEQNRDLMNVVQKKLSTLQAHFRDAKEIPNAVKVMVELCTGELEYRPSPQFLIKELSKLRNRKSGIVDLLMEHMEGYMAQLEEKVQERTAALESQAGQLKSVTDKMQDILCEVLPMQIAKQLIAGQRPEPEQFECVTILFSDVVDFTNISSMLQPKEVMELLNDLWLMFDEVTSKHDVYKLDTIGDCYMIGSGIPSRNEMKHVKEIADMSMTLLKACRSSRIRSLGGNPIRVRAGINSGPVIAGVVGLKMPQYCVFGDTVNTSSRMESTSLPMKIQISTTTKDLLNKHYEGEYKTQLRGHVELKGKGRQETFWLIPAGSEAEADDDQQLQYRSKTAVSNKSDHDLITLDGVEDAPKDASGDAAAAGESVEAAAAAEPAAAAATGEVAIDIGEQ